MLAMSGVLEVKSIEKIILPKSSIIDFNYLFLSYDLGNILNRPPTIL